ncbi:DUF1365 domain-containing protein [Ideonella sp.]|uniref:DUF1365 domain-containing protein n=1 Tax=Ideonella sp. TaxID=1929293 RepID=UPI0035B02925
MSPPGRPQGEYRRAQPDGAAVGAAGLGVAQPLLGVGEVRHARLRPVQHAFAYPTCFLLLPMRRLREQPVDALHRNRFSAFGFHDADHGEGGPDSLAWFEALLARAGVADADGEIWLHTLPRMWGHRFKPVSFWYAHRADGSLAAVLAEVNNTFGERHCYLLQGDGLAWGREMEAAKVFHVSPFCRASGRYRFRFLRTAPGDGHAGRTVVRVAHDDAEGPLLLTSVSGRLQPLTGASRRAVLRRMPWHALGVVLRIHWQALRLWWRGVPVFSKPAPPAHAVSRGAGPSRA